MQGDREAVRSAVAKYGGDSDEADAAQQRLLRDRGEYRGLRRSLQQAGVSVPPDATSTGMGNRGNQRAIAVITGMDITVAAGVTVK